MLTTILLLSMKIRANDIDLRDADRLFNNEYFEHIDGGPAGGKASNLIAYVIMSYIVDKATEITPSQYRQSFCVYRYVDDC